MSTTYTKLRNGDWGLRGSGLVDGSAVTVTKKSGETKVETVGKVLWTGNGISIATIMRSGGGRDSAGNHIYNGDSYKAGVTAPHGRTCPMCGSRECSRAWDPRDLCDED